MKTYSEKLKDPRWQKKRLEVFERDDFTCIFCKSKDKTLNVHHKKYSKTGNPWDVQLSDLITLCENCHTQYEIHKKTVKENLEQIDYGFDSEIFTDKFLELIYLIRTNPEMIPLIHQLLYKYDVDVQDSFNRGYYLGTSDVLKNKR